jgi:hypothetical protein
MRLTDLIEGHLEWLYVLHPDTYMVVVYEATVHDRWLRHQCRHPMAATLQRRLDHLHRGDQQAGKLK